MKSIALLFSLLLSTFAFASKPHFNGCETQACDTQKLAKLQDEILNSVKAQSGYIMADSIYLEFSVNEKGNVNVMDEFSTSSMLTLIFAKKMLNDIGDSLAPTTEESYKWSWNIDLPEFTESFKSLYETDYFPIVTQCNTFNRKGKRGCFQYLGKKAENDLGSIDEKMSLKLFIKEGQVAAAEAPHPPISKATTDRFILLFNQQLQESTSYTSRKNSDNFWIEFEFSFDGDSTTRYTSQIKRLGYLSTLPSKAIYHEELLDFTEKQFVKKPEEGANFLINQLSGLGLDSTKPYVINGRIFTMDSLMSVVPNPEDEETESGKSVSFQLVESVPVFEGCSGEVGDNEKLKQCFQTGILKFVAYNFKYPEAARKKRIQGRIYVNFVIQKDGSIEEIKVVRGVHPTLDYESIRVISEIPDAQQPAIQKGEPVLMSFTLPINAKLR